MIHSLLYLCFFLPPQLFIRSKKYVLQKRIYALPWRCDKPMDRLSFPHVKHSTLLANVGVRSHRLHFVLARARGSFMRSLPCSNKWIPFRARAQSNLPGCLPAALMIKFRTWLQIFQIASPKHITESLQRCAVHI